jgi:hypothetical protein
MKRLGLKRRGVLAFEEAHPRCGTTAVGKANTGAQEWSILNRWVLTVRCYPFAGFRRLCSLGFELGFCGKTFSLVLRHGSSSGRNLLMRNGTPHPWQTQAFPMQEEPFEQQTASTTEQPRKAAKSVRWDGLTFDAKGEIIIFVGRNSRFARTLDAVLALLAHLFFLHHRKLPSARSEFLRGVNHATRGSV